MPRCFLCPVFYSRYLLCMFGVLLYIPIYIQWSDNKTNFVFVIHKHPTKKRL
jgi:hypothetical protein